MIREWLIKLCVWISDRAIDAGMWLIDGRPRRPVEHRHEWELIHVSADGKQIGEICDLCKETRTTGKGA